jgi:hypothetical protein
MMLEISPIPALRAVTVKMMATMLSADIEDPLRRVVMLKEFKGLLDDATELVIQELPADTRPLR